MSDKLTSRLAINRAVFLQSINGFTIARHNSGAHSVWREDSGACIATGLTLQQAYSAAR
jgi:hypothetical protein